MNPMPAPETPDNLLNMIPAVAHWLRWDQLYYNHYLDALVKGFWDRFNSIVVMLQHRFFQATEFGTLKRDLSL
jgi:hypothetical protein